MTTSLRGFFPAPGFLVRLIAAAALTAAAGTAAYALTLEQANENCRNTVGRAFVQTCANGNRGMLEACRAKASPQVRACTQAAMNKANARANVPIAMNKQAAPKAAPGNALPAGFVAPPRSIADITAILDQEKQNPQAIARLQAAADDEPAKGLSAGDLAEFYADRAFARASLGRNVEALADAEKGMAAAYKDGDSYYAQRIRQVSTSQKTALGDIKGTYQGALQMVKESDKPGQRGYAFGANQTIASVLVQMGDIPQAESYLRKTVALLTEARTSGNPGWRQSYEIKGRSWEGSVEATRGIIFEARGQFRDAEAAYAKSRDWRIAWIPDLKRNTQGPSEAQIRNAADDDLLNVARMKAKQARLAEAEADMRSALLSRLRAVGKYNPITVKYIVGLAGIMVDQGRYGDAEQLARTALDIQRTLKIGDDTQTSAQIIAQLGAVLTLQRKPEAAAVYAELDRAIAKWEPGRRMAFELNGSRIDALLASGQTEKALGAAQALLKREIARVGDKHFDTANARGTLAIAYTRSGRDAEAIQEFRVAVPILLASSREQADDEDSSVKASRDDRLQTIVENYIRLLAKSSATSANAPVESFALADSVRGRAVQAALAESSARASIKDPALAELVRREQDLSKQVNAQLGLYNNLLALPAAERGEQGIRGIAASVEKLRGDRDRARAEINAKFPAYADLVSPKPPTVEQIKATLVPGEAMVSFYFGREASFVWAVPKDGNVAFASIPATSGDIASKIGKLREALEPQAAMISDIPPFDVKLAHELYATLLKPVEAGWKPAKNLIVVTNGALGLLPLSLLPTADVEQPDPSGGDVLFGDYRKVPWLARTHAVTMVPSSAALRTLRGLPSGKDTRKELIAFGDPLFSRDQEKEAAMQVASLDQTKSDAVSAGGANVTRGLPLKRRNSPKLEGVDSAELGLLPRLPDTADELRSIALALKANPAEVLNLGKDANEGKVKTMDLSGFKILAFATHGLVPGELNGLTQPALALSAPDVNGSGGDGLLTMEDILGLKLDADWVVLSACNTGAGQGAGAEAASGLGRAFFYAGTRALLVTNWSVHSQSARELVTDLFKRQADDKSITRGEALRQAMMALADGPGYANEQGKTEFAYAHPLFWAPYTIIGDGGRR